MMYPLLTQVIQYIERFEREGNGTDVNAFAQWLQQEVQVPGHSEKNLPAGHFNLQESVASLLGQMEAYSKHYLKYVLQETPLVSSNDYVFLIILERLGDQRKTDLISIGIMEISSGIEVIKRLLRNRLVEDYPDPNDGRSKRVRLTDAGRLQMKQLSSKMNQLGQILVGPLTTDEQQQLVHLLHKLHRHHEQIWQQDRDSNLEEIIQKYHG